MVDLIDRFLGWFSPQRTIAADGASYRIYTTEFDCELAGASLDQALGPIGSFEEEHEKAWSDFSEALSTARARAIAADAAARAKMLLDQGTLNNTTIAILIDQSGSMRGQNMLSCAAAVAVGADFLLDLAIPFEVLGFTTRSWRGGNSRRKWKRKGKRRLPGRLCDLLHIIYRSSDEGVTRIANSIWKAMLRPDVLKENIDGEALEWAASRLRRREESRKLLLVISDGAPVDDSTLMANPPDILTNHLREVVRRLEESDDLRIAAVGIGFDEKKYYDVGAYYSNGRTAKTPEGLEIVVIKQLESLLVPETLMTQ